MELFQTITAVWGGTGKTEASCDLTITIDVTKIIGMLKRFDLFTITDVTIESQGGPGDMSQTMEYEYTRLHREVVGDTIAFQVRVYGEADVIVVKECTTKGYYVIKEVQNGIKNFL